MNELTAPAWRKLKIDFCCTFIKYIRMERIFITMEAIGSFDILWSIKLKDT